MLGPKEAAGPLRAHIFAVNEVGISFLETTRKRGDEFGPVAWRHEIAHPMSRGRGHSRRTLFADAVLTYLLLEEKQIAIEQRLVELDRTTLSVDRLVSELARYAKLYRAANKRGGIRSRDLRLLRSLALVAWAGFWLVEAVQVGPRWTELRSTNPTDRSAPGSHARRQIAVCRRVGTPPE